MDEEKKDRGFVIKDRRFSAEADEKRTEPESGNKEKTIEQQSEANINASGPSETQQPPPYPTVNFTNFVISLSSSVLFNFGDIPDPVTNKAQRDLDAAKHTIDLLGMLQEKTRGNLTDDEQKLIDAMLFELRMRYVREKEKG